MYFTGVWGYIGLYIMFEQGMLFHDDLASMVAGFNSAGIPEEGLSYTPEFIEPEAEAAIIENIDASGWNESLSRRMQHYGVRYDVKVGGQRGVARAEVKPMPLWLAPLAVQLKTEGVFSERPDQAHINEYLPGQGIALHTDQDKKFNNSKIAIVSLGSGCAFCLEDSFGGRSEIYLERRSLLVMSDKVRYNYKHGILKRKSDLVFNKKIARYRRLAVIFRQSSRT